jgi:2-iminobutanoate/2-iminopropanoate deaminase
MKTVYTDKAPKPVGPYSQAVLAGPGEVLFISGQLGLDGTTGELVKGGAGNEAAEALRNLGAVLEAAGMKKEDVAKTTIFLKDLNDFSLINGLYEEFFGDHKPARSTFEVARLPKGGLVEIEAIAVKGKETAGRK